MGLSRFTESLEVGSWEYWKNNGSNGGLLYSSSVDTGDSKAASNILWIEYSELFNQRVADWSRLLVFSLRGCVVQLNAEQFDEMGTSSARIIWCRKLNSQWRQNTSAPFCLFTTAMIHSSCRQQKVHFRRSVARWYRAWALSFWWFWIPSMRVEFDFIMCL